jgi:hypothetical protein
MRGNKAKRIADLQQVENKQSHWAANSQYNFIRVQFPNGVETGLLFTDKEIERALKRAEKNPEDLPETSWIRNIFD